MSNYVGVRCPVCTKKFSSSDDIVVCPACGAPHHRECYSRVGECAFSADHMSGKEWRPPQPETPPDSSGDETLSCARCGSQNPGGAIFCQICGANISHVAQSAHKGQSTGDIFREIYSDPFGGVRGDESIAGVPVADIACYVGPRAPYYIPRFYAFDKQDRQIMPSISAFLFTYYYCFYRKMYAVGAALLGVYLVSLVPFFLLAGELGMDAMTEWILGTGTRIFTDKENLYITLFNYVNIANTALRVGFALFANQIYFNHTVKRVQKLSSRRDSLSGASEYRRALGTAGGVDKVGVLVLGGTIFLATGAVLMFIWLGAM